MSNRRSVSSFWTSAIPCHFSRRDRTSSRFWVALNPPTVNSHPNHVRCTDLPSLCQPSFHKTEQEAHVSEAVLVGDEYRRNCRDEWDFAGQPTDHFRSSYETGGVRLTVDQHAKQRPADIDGELLNIFCTLCKKVKDIICNNGLYTFADNYIHK